MNAELWQRSKEIFATAMETPQTERNAFVECACGDDEELRAEVERLLGGASNEDTFLDKAMLERLTEVAEPERCLKTGDAVAGRFTIVKLLGIGGMGEVYEARDTVRNERVALKVLKSDGPLSPEGERRLRREVELAQRIGHRNICRVHDLYLHNEGRRFLALSMELLEGKSLSQLKAEGKKLPLDKVEEVARQICLGIDAAHAANVIHRDLKPSNVMLVERAAEVRVVITDFGIARSVSPHTQSTMTAWPAGTPLYMAPEQFEGKADERSDLYSVCLILYELATGRGPYRGEKDAESGLLSADSGLSPAWRKMLLKGLSGAPQARFRRGAEIAEAIKSRSALHQRLLAVELKGRAAWIEHRTALLAGIAVPLAALGGLAIWRAQAPPMQPFAKLAFGGLEKEGTEDAVIAGAADSLLAALRQSPHLKVSGHAELAATFARMGMASDAKPDAASMREAALRNDDRVLLLGSVGKPGGYKIHLEFQKMADDPRRPVAGPQRDFTASGPAEAFRAIEEAARWVRQLSGESANEFKEQDAAPEDLTTGSWKALQLVRDAEARRAGGDSASALVFAEEALAADPGFATAESLRGDILAELKRYKSAFEAYKHALELVRARNVSGRERYEIEAKFHEDGGDYAAATQSYRAWIAHFPNDYLPHFYLGGVLSILGEDAEALGQMEMARALNERNFVIYPHLAAHYMAAKRWQDAAICAQRLRDLGEPEWATAVEGRLRFAQGDYASALAAFRKLALRKDEFWQGLSPFYIARSQAEGGWLAEAAETLLIATSLDRQRGNRSREAERRVAMAYIAWQQGNAARVQEEIKKAMGTLESPESVGLAGELLARTNDVRGAAEVLGSLDRWTRVPRVERARRRLEAEIALGRHHMNAAKLFKEAETDELTPLAIDFALRSALVRQDRASLQAAISRLFAHPDMLMDSITGAWWGTPGLYLLASCNDVSSERKITQRGCPARVN